MKVGFLLHLITLLWVLFGFYLFNKWQLFIWLFNGFFLIKSIILLFYISFPLFPQLDARSRYQNYKLVKDHLHMFGFQARIIRPFKGSNCQRNAVNVAAAELGISDVTRDYFKKAGYKWYHFLPEAVVYDPPILLTKKFWKVTLFTKTYHSKIDFSLSPNLPVFKI